MRLWLCQRQQFNVLKKLRHGCVVAKLQMSRTSSCDGNISVELWLPFGVSSHTKKCRQTYSDSCKETGNVDFYSYRRKLRASSSSSTLVLQMLEVVKHVTKRPASQYLPSARRTQSRLLAKAFCSHLLAMPACPPVNLPPAAALVSTCLPLLALHLS